MKKIITFIICYIVCTLLTFSTDNPWSIINNGTATMRIRSIYANTNGLIMFSASTEGIFKSTNNGANWKQANDSLSLPSTILDFNNNSGSNILIASDADGIMLSTDEGVTWSKKTGGLGYASCIAKSSDGTLYIGTKSNIMKSTNAGETWSKCNQGLDVVPVKTIIIDKSNNIYISQGEAGAFYSTNAGGSWNKMINGIDSISITSLAISSDGSLFASNGNNAIYKSVDNGSSWNCISTSWLSGNTITSNLFCSSEGYIAFGTNVNGIFITTDNGITWTNQAGDISGVAISAGYMSKDGYIYVGNSNGLLFRRKTLPLPVKELVSSEDINIYPNPVYDNLTIKYNNSQSVSLKYQIIGVDGINYYENTINNNFEGNSISLNLANIPVGSYFVKIIANNQVIYKPIVKLSR